MDNPLKTCKKCGQPKAKVEFGKCKNSRDRLQYWCNAGLGQFNDDIQQLFDAIEYLKLWHSNQRGA